MNHMNKVAIAAVAAASIGLSAGASAREVSVEITNLSNAIYFTPLLVATHDRDTHLFELASPASPALQAMAEGGDISALVAEVEAAGGTAIANPAGGLLGPGQSTTVRLEVRGRHDARLSVVAMLLPTNDGFVGADALRIPRHGARTVYLMAYDAGTEANDEVITGGGAPGAPGIPADPGGNAGSGASGVTGPDHNPTVHLHRGIVGDDDVGGGASDLDSAVHRWNGPVARLRIVTERSREHHDD